jgi:hypothetical protein
MKVAPMQGSTLCGQEKPGSAKTMQTMEKTMDCNGKNNATNNGNNENFERVSVPAVMPQDGDGSA